MVHGVTNSRTWLSDFTFQFPFWASLVAQLVKNPPAMWGTWVRSLGWEDPLEKGKAAFLSRNPLENSMEFSSILAWKIPWTLHGVAKSQTWLSDFHSLSHFTVDGQLGDKYLGHSWRIFWDISFGEHACTVDSLYPRTPHHWIQSTRDWKYSGKKLSKSKTWINSTRFT